MRFKIKLENTMEESIIYKAIDDFSPRVGEELGLKSGDTVKQVPNTTPQRGFVYAVNSRSLEFGWAPIDYLDKVEVRLSGYTYHPSYLDVDRKMAELVLMRSHLKKGSFLLRDCSSRQDFVVLSVRSSNNSIRHYRIKLSQKAGSCQLVAKGPQPRFTNIASLISYYSSGTEGSVQLLKPVAEKLESPEGIFEYEISKDEIMLEKNIGHGSFGEVWKGEWRDLSVAVKKVKPGSSAGHAMLLNEALFLSSVWHKNIVNLIAVSLSSEPLMMVTELLNGSLRDYLRSKEGRHSIRIFPQMVNFMRQIADGMRYLNEERRICHRDLRSANVLLDRNEKKPEDQQLSVKIADFGLAKLLDDVSPESSKGSECSSDEDLRFPAKWTAIEAMRRKKFSDKTDVWSFGIVFYELLSYGAMPYRGKSAREAVDFIKQGGRISSEECQTDESEECGGPVVKCPEKIYQLMALCWRANPRERPSFSTICDYLQILASKTQM